MALINSFETIYKEIENLLINRLPENIEIINKEHNDGIILKPFQNTSLEENCIKTPSFSFKMEEAEYSEKDRIIENTVYTINLEIKLPSDIDKMSIIFYRYIKAIDMALKEVEGWQKVTILNTRGNKVFIRITV
jgi:hypothetical protein